MKYAKAMNPQLNSIAHQVLLSFQNHEHNQVKVSGKTGNINPTLLWINIEMVFCAVKGVVVIMWSQRSII
jgi:hypothetical protein